VTTNTPRFVTLQPDDPADAYDAAFAAILHTCFDARTPDDAVDAKLDTFELFDAAYHAAACDADKIMVARWYAERYGEEAGNG
jgi:hypothetical protein